MVCSGRFRPKISLIVLPEIWRPTGRTKSDGGGLDERSGISERSPLARVLDVGEIVSCRQLGVGENILGIADRKHQDTPLHGALVQFTFRVGEEECGDGLIEAGVHLGREIVRRGLRPIDAEPQGMGSMPSSAIQRKQRVGTGRL